MPWDRHVISAGGHPLPVTDSGGEGPVVLLLHGWTATAAINWGSVVESMGHRHRLVMFDQRGHGDGVPRGPHRTTLGTLADDAVVVMDELGVSSAVVVGYSMGGAVAQQMVFDHRTRVQAMVLAATSTYFVTAGAPRMVAEGVLGKGADTVRALGPDHKRALVQALADRRQGDAPLAGVDVVASGHDLTVLIELGQSLATFDSRGWWPAAPVPTSVIATTNDAVIPFARQLETMRHLGGARLHPVVGGHSVCLDNPAAFSQVLTAALCDVGVS